MKNRKWQTSPLQGAWSAGILRFMSLGASSQDATKIVTEIAICALSYAETISEIRKLVAEVTT